MPNPSPQHAPTPPAALDLSGRPQIMGILNLTPDSFSDGGLHNAPDQAIQHALHMASQGADIIDVGGESTRPGAQRIPSKEQITRVVPIIKSLRQHLADTHPAVRISIDTTRADVAAAAIDAGASILNDVSAAREDPAILTLAAKHRLPIILMHMQGQPGHMQDNPTYTDVAAEVRDFLLARALAAQDAGVDRDQIILDPGIGFGKTTQHNLTLLRELPDLVAQAYPVMVGASRKRFLSALSSSGGVAPGMNPANPREVGGQTQNHPTPAPTAGRAVEDRLGGTCAVTAHCVALGVKLLRVHDVAENRQAANLAWALSGPTPGKTS